MVNIEEATIEELIITNIDEAFEKSTIINSNLEENGILKNEHMIINNKINKIKSTLHICELEFEYDDNKKAINERIDNILTAENTIINNIKEKGVENSLTIINQKINTIKTEVKELEKKLLEIFDYSILFGDNADIRNHIKKYKQQLTFATQDITNKTERALEEFKQKSSALNDAQNVNEVRNKEISLQMDELNASITKKVSEQDKEFEELKKGAEDKFDLLKKNIENKDEEISKLIGLIGNKANIGEYKKYADNADKERTIWQILTVSTFLLAFIIMMAITFFTKNYNLTTLVRYIVTIILFGMSGYTAKQAGNLRKDAVYYRKQQLELSSIDVYLADMPDGIKQNIKVELSNKIFGQARETYKNKYDDNANDTIDKISKMVETILNSINKTVN